VEDTIDKTASDPTTWPAENVRRAARRPAGCGGKKPVHRSAGERGCCGLSMLYFFPLPCGRGGAGERNATG